MPKKKPTFLFDNTDKSTSHKFATSKTGYFDKDPEFSFKYYAHTHKKYSFKCITVVDDFHEMFDRLKAISSLKWGGIQQSSQFHFHEISWKETSEPSGFKELVPSILKAYPACQFKIFKECRIIGFFNRNNIFEIVWVDRYHSLYKRK